MRLNQLKLGFSISSQGLAPDNRVLFSALVTNIGESPIVLESIRYEWTDDSSSRDSAAAFRFAQKTMTPGQVETTIFVIPRTASKVRIRAECKSALHKQLDLFVLKLADLCRLRLPSCANWLWQISFSCRESYRSIASPWRLNTMTNSSLTSSITIPSSAYTLAR